MGSHGSCERDRPADDRHGAVHRRSDLAAPVAAVHVLLDPAQPRRRRLARDAPASGSLTGAFDRRRRAAQRQAIVSGRVGACIPTTRATLNARETTATTPRLRGLTR